MSFNTGSLQSATQAFKEGRYLDAIGLLEQYLAQAPSPGSPDYSRAQVTLVKAYQQANELNKALNVTRQLLDSTDPHTQDWARKKVDHLTYLGATLHSPPAVESLPVEASSPVDSPAKAVELISEASIQLKEPSPIESSIEVPMPSVSEPPPQPLEPPHTSAQPAQPDSTKARPWTKVPFSQPRQLRWAMIGTVVVVIGLAAWILLLPYSRLRLFQRLLVVLSLLINGGCAGFFLAPYLQDMIHTRFYRTRWISFKDLENLHPTAARTLASICDRYTLKLPRLGLIQSPIPVAAIYGSMTDHARLVVSKGLFDYLSTEEIATICAQQMGRVISYEVPVLTVMSLPGQLSYLLYGFTSQWGEGRGKSKQKDIILGNIAPLFYFLFQVFTFPLFIISRLGILKSDHFATEATGDPNSLSLALLSMAHGVTQETQHLARPSLVLDGVRLFSPFDPKNITVSETAFRAQAQPEHLRQILLWDLYNPWAKGMQFNSSHPLPGQRLYSLSQYAIRLRIPALFELQRIPGEGKSLNKKKLVGQFQRETLFYVAEVIGLVVGWIGGMIAYFTLRRSGLYVIMSGALIGFGIGLIAKSILMFPKAQDPVDSDVMTLMADPYASPRSQQLVVLKGALFGRGRVGFQLGSELKLQDETGIIPVRYTSRFGPVGNFLTGLKAIRQLVGSEVAATGWLRRGMSPWLDILRIQTGAAAPVNSYPRSWFVLLGLGVMGSGILIGLFYPALNNGWQELIYRLFPR